MHGDDTVGVVDFHMHVYEKPWNSWVVEYLKKINPQIDYTRPIDEGILIREMDSAGVELGVVFAESTPEVTGTVSNEFVARLGKNDRIIPFCSVNPSKSENVVEILEYCINELSMKGLKLLPSYMYFYPNDTKVYPLYEKAVELDIPVVFHTGTSIFRNVRQKYADPLLLDDVAVDFPDLKIVMAHSGRGLWYNTALMLARIHDNVYLEFSGLPPKRIPEYFPNLEELEDKLIFGSDWPGCNLRELVNGFKNLPYSNKVKRKMLRENALKLLKVE
jgi:hypothetical protein